MAVLLKCVRHHKLLRNCLRRHWIQRGQEVTGLIRSGDAEVLPRKARVLHLLMRLRVVLLP